MDLGYDVWIANNRGTVFSNVHRNYTDKEGQFWDFTFHEMGEFDVPANLNFILKKTGVSQVIYVGHSQGTIQWFVANSLYPDIHRHFKAFIGMSPEAFLGNNKGFAAVTERQINIAKVFYEFYDYFLYIPSFPTYGTTIIHYLPRFTWTLIGMIFGFDNQLHVDLGRLPMLARNDLGGTSAKNLYHWS